MVGRRGRIAVVLGPLLALLLLLAARQAPRPAGDVTPAVSVSPNASAPPESGVLESGVPESGVPESGVPESAVPIAAVPDVAAQAVASSCPGPTALSGLCGTVAGFSGFYGSWRTAGSAGAFCLEHAKKEPLASLGYTKYSTGAGHTSMTAEDRQRLGYLLGSYGTTTDSTTAAALAILVHAAEGDSLTTAQLSSFTTSLPAAVRIAVGALWSEAAQDHGPYTASVSVGGLAAGARATVTVHSSAGHPMSGFPVSWAGSSHGDEVNVTNSSGQATLTVATVTPGGTVSAHASVTGLPADDIGVWVPSDSTVQKVAVALPAGSVAAAGTWTAAVAPASVQVLKTTTDPGYVSPAGAVFTLTDSAGRVVGSLHTGVDGHSEVLGGLIAANGPFTVTETQPCAQCLTAPPQSVALAAGQAGAVTFTDAPSPVRLVLEKVTPDGQPIAGAVLHVRRSSAPGGPFDVDLGVCTSTLAGCHTADPTQYVPGDYQITEEQPAPGTAWSAPSVQTVALHSGSAKVVFTDPRLTSVGFRKIADPSAGAVDPAHEDLAGAVFAVSGPALPTAAGVDPTVIELGRCTTAADGTCTIPGDPLVEGTGYDWSEITAPPGFALDPSVHAFTACAAPCDGQSVTATDQGRYAHVTLFKHVTGDPATAVSGAVVDLCATGLPATLAATFSTPEGSACDPATTTVATGSTDAHGAIDFGLLPPGAHYCAVERSAPTGFEVNPDPVCGDLGPAGLVTDPAPQPLALDLADTPTPPAPSPTPHAPALPAAATAAPQPVPSTRVLAVSTARPKPRSPQAVPTVAPPIVAPPVLPQAPLAFTGAEQVGHTLELGFGLLLLGLALVLGASPRSSWGNRGSRRPGPSTRHRG